jgi:hypothetical protein
VRWAAHNVKLHRTGIKRFHHPLVGPLTLTFEGLELAADPGQRLNVYTAEPGSPFQHALDLLASWISTPADVEVHDKAEQSSSSRVSNKSSTRDRRS